MQPNNVNNGVFYSAPPEDNQQNSYNYQSGRRPDASDPKPSRFKEHLSTIIILVAAPLLAVLITTFVFRTYQVDGPSMETTLQDGDRLIINKLPRTWAKVTGGDFIPKRYDIVVFSHEGQFSSSGAGSKRQLIKRVIGLPGDRVVVSAGVVTVYNEENPNGFLVDRFGPEAGVVESTDGKLDVDVGQGELFVMGDNRRDSLDSRSLGTVKADKLVGKLTFRVYPFDKWSNY